MYCRGLFRGGWGEEGGGGGVTIFIEVNRQASLMNWQISPYFFSEYPISLTVTKLLDTLVGPIPLWHIHGGKCIEKSRVYSDRRLKSDSNLVCFIFQILE